MCIDNLSIAQWRQVWVWSRFLFFPKSCFVVANVTVNIVYCIVCWNAVCCRYQACQCVHHSPRCCKVRRSWVGTLLQFSNWQCLLFVWVIANFKIVWQIFWKRWSFQHQLQELHWKSHNHNSSPCSVIIGFKLTAL